MAITDELVRNREQYADGRQNIARIHAEPAIPIKDSARGFVYDVASGTLREVS